MARIVLLVNFILFSLSWTAVSASSDVEVSSAIAKSSNISNSPSSSDAGSLSSSGSESFPASSAASSSKSSDSTVFSSRKSAPEICPKGKKKSSCPKHEVRTKCIQAYCTPQKCSERGRAIPCPAIAGPCEKGCVCASGYLRNSKGRCIPENRCPPVCPINEEFSNCTQAVCRQQTCKDKKLPLSCPAINEGECNSGCVCQSGYLRTSEGECVSQNQCSGNLVCKTNEVVNNCPNSGHGDCCPRSEKDAKSRKQSKVITECEEQSCTCRFNYMRADNGTCIPARDCPPFNCTGENEEFNPCPPLCPTDDCAQATPSGRCPLPGRIGIVLQCRADCRCKSGFWRKNGVCVPYSECPGICPLNEEYSDCIQSVCRAQNCTQKGKPIACAGITEGSCEKGCICSNGFLRDEHGNCISDDQCPAPKCDGQNEVLADCPNGCDPINCPESLQAEQEKLAGCFSIAVCLPPECRCRPNYRRDEEGTCIPIEECPGICPDNEEFSNCTQALCRAQNCTQIGKSIACARIAEGFCEKGCVCSNGFLRDELGNCVPEDKCPASKCDGQNEVLAECPNVCDPINCPESLQAEQERLASCISITVCLAPDCRCRPDYRRDEQGSCIPIGECPGICPVNEEFSNCTQALCRAQNCTQREKPIACLGIAEDSCEKRCVCSTGFLRNLEGNCVPEDQCPVCRSNENFSNCIQAICRTLNCSQRGFPLTCPSVAKSECRNGCVCQGGLLKTAKGNCVSDSQCYGDLVCDDNEVAIASRNNATNDYCPRFEGDKGEISENTSEAEGPVCVCRFNHKRSYENGTCIPTVECPSFKCNRPYEEYRSCPPWCPSDNCSQATPTGRCQIFGRIGIVLECNPKCRCIQGYWRDNGTCVPYAACPGKCPTNERYSSCIQAECRALNCTQKGKPIACPRLVPGACKNGCVCVEGTLRAENGSCIPEKECPAGKCPTNERYSSCIQAECRALNCTQKGKPIACPRLVPGACKNGCVCVEGTLRAENGSCIPEIECPAGKCPTNERYSSCIQAECRALNCTQKGKPIACPRLVPGACKNGCVCVEGTLRAENGSCIPEIECPAGKCPTNERYSSCIQAECRALNCTQKGKPIACPRLVPGACKNGCVCVEGTLRAENGSCIPEIECPAGKCPTNERYSSCIQAECRALNCTQKGKPIACPRLVPGACKNGCVCVEGTLRAENGSCIPEIECPAGKCPTNERYSSCIQAECRALNCTQKGKPIACPRLVPGACKKGCVCVEGTLRAENGSCISEIECPAPKCDGQNEVLADCPNGCDPINCPESLQAEQEKLAGCFSIAVCLPPECRCRPNYRRDDEGTCIPIEKCPGICPDNEEFSNCTQALCRAQNCTQKGNPIACAGVVEDSCEKGCVCLSGFLRDEHGKCIPDDQCPAIVFLRT